MNSNLLGKLRSIRTTIDADPILGIAVEVVA